MRAIHRTLKGLLPLAALVALMAVPSVASATYWGEYDYDPIGGTPTSEDVVTAEVAGAITIEVNQTVHTTLTCDVEGEVELSNDWDHPSGSPATNRIVSLGLAGSVSQSCTGQYASYSQCDPSSVQFSGFPWSGNTASGHSTFSGLEVVFAYKTGPAWCTGIPTLSTGGTLDGVFPFANGSGQGDCLDLFLADGGWLSGWGAVPSSVSGELWVDHNTLEGLSTDEGGPCVTINEA